MTSDNTFLKRSFTKSSNSFSSRTFQKSSNGFAVRVFSKGSEIWKGDNISAAAFGVGDIFGGPFSVFGTDTFGGIDHKNKTQSSVSH